MIITREAIEAAAKVMATQTDEPPYGESPELDAEYRRDTREILEAATLANASMAQEAKALWEHVATGDPLLTCPTCCAAVAWSEKEGHDKWHEAIK